MGVNMTDSGNATDISLCSMEKKPEATQECGASSKEEGDTKPTEESTAEVSYTVFRVKLQNDIYQFRYDAFLKNNFITISF